MIDKGDALCISPLTTSQRRGGTSTPQPAYAVCRTSWLRPRTWWEVANYPPPPVNEKKHSELFYNCARIGSFRSVPAACYMRAPRPHGCGAWICARLREHPRGEAPLGLYRICFNSAPTPRRPSARFSLHAESRRPAFSVWAVDSSCPYPSFFGSVCSVPAKAKKFFEAFAAFLQRPKSFSRRLQHSCKGQKVFRGACSIPAKAKKFLGAFAAFLQAPKYLLLSQRMT